ncbi:hypothetical protein SLS62_004597 [Diatrype stigma]|uniref:F-box domain-containing protein n=1 Tax=Diatrype stigma TaxID=117547 RepID=A0AAN9UUI7_9PEZI
MSLLALPNELLLEIMEHLSDSQQKRALQSVASTCKALHDIAEAYLYSSAVFTTKSTFVQFLKATAIDQRRCQYLQELKLAFSSRQYESELKEAISIRQQQYKNPDYISKPDLGAFENLRRLVSESSECQPWSHKGTLQWKVYMETFMHVFEQASLLNQVPIAQRPLQKLESLTLHWSGFHGRYWDISPTCPIFLLPQLRSLEISCARIGQVVSGPTGSWDEEPLRSFSRQTQLRSLALIECTVSVEALAAILSLPTALQHLTLYETSHHEIDVLYDRFATADSDLFNGALAQQAASLERLEIMACPSYASLPGNIRRPLLLALGDFVRLTHLRLGPFRSARRGSVHTSDLCGLRSPPPPALVSLRLDDFLLSLLTPRSTDEVLSELLIDELVAGAAARNKGGDGAPFQLDIALARMTAYLQRLQRLQRIPDQRPLVRKLVQGFAENFQRRQQHSRARGTSFATASSSPASSPSSSSPSSSSSSSSAEPASRRSSSSPEPTTTGGSNSNNSNNSGGGGSDEDNDNDDDQSAPAAARLRILTSKRVHVIPPYLHAEKRPRFVVRYDSSHPHRFIPDAHLASVDPYGEVGFYDDDISSEDEDIEAAFNQQ